MGNQATTARASAVAVRNCGEWRSEGPRGAVVSEGKEFGVQYGHDRCLHAANRPACRHEHDRICETVPTALAMTGLPGIANPVIRRHGYGMPIMRIPVSVGGVRRG
jgi:hypothetical protein